MIVRMELPTATIARLLPRRRAMRWYRSPRKVSVLAAAATISPRVAANQGLPLPLGPPLGLPAELRSMGGELGPGDQVPRSGEPRHVDADRHVLVSRISALGTGPVSPDYLDKHQLHGISLERIRRDRILQEALASGAGPLHLSLVFNIDHANALAYASDARNLLSSPAGQALSRRPAGHEDPPGTRAGADDDRYGKGRVRAWRRQQPDARAPCRIGTADCRGVPAIFRTQIVWLRAS